MAAEKAVASAGRGRTPQALREEDACHSESQFSSSDDGDVHSERLASISSDEGDLPFHAEELAPGGRNRSRHVSFRSRTSHIESRMLSCSSDEGSPSHPWSDSYSPVSFCDDDDDGDNDHALAKFPANSPIQRPPRALSRQTVRSSQRYSDSAHPLRLEAQDAGLDDDAFTNVSLYSCSVVTELPVVEAADPFPGPTALATRQADEEQSVSSTAGEKLGAKSGSRSRLRRLRDWADKQVHGTSAGHRIDVELGRKPRLDPCQKIELRYADILDEGARWKLQPTTVEGPDGRPQACVEVVRRTPLRARGATVAICLLVLYCVAMSAAVGVLALKVQSK